MKVKIVNIVDLSTVKVSLETKKRHQKYGKYLTVTKFFLVDVSGANVAINQYVNIASCRPISKNKKWVIV